ncbi:MAG: hypothetical protein SWE60_27200 [Thermodesulfobacteriota bacterium]|nr:hypothetical protein [Thermodesulfobacteriota bacterium]
MTKEKAAREKHPPEPVLQPGNTHTRLLILSQNIGSFVKKMKDNLIHCPFPRGV